MSNKSYEFELQLQQQRLTSFVGPGSINTFEIPIASNILITDLNLKNMYQHSVNQFKLQLRLDRKVKLMFDNASSTQESREKHFEYVWQYLTIKHRQGQWVFARTLDPVKGGAIVGILGLPAFMPRSLAPINRPFPGDLFPVCILKMIKLKRNIVVAGRLKYLRKT